MTGVLVDTSVWVSHLRDHETRLDDLLLEEQVVSHPFVIGELACGHIHNRQEVLSLLQALPQAPELSHHEILQFINSHNLMARGVGLVDVHLLASARLAETPLWTRDKALKAVSDDMEIRFLE